MHPKEYYELDDKSTLQITFLYFILENVFNIPIPNKTGPNSLP